jgi:Ca2+-binding RTX toxin-like protein
MRRKALWMLALPALAVPVAQAGDRTGFTLALTGGQGANEIAISLSSDRTEYVIRANGPVPPVGGCANPPEDPNELRCPATDVVAFLVRTRGGNDTVTMRSSVRRAAIVNGGPGIDDLAAGGNADRLIGGDGDDRLAGGAAADSLYGGAGDDILLGGAGNDTLRGGGGQDRLFGGPGRDDERF